VKIVVIAGYAKSLVNFRGPLLLALLKAGHEVIACAPEDDQKVTNILNSMGVHYRTVPLERTGMNPVKDLISLVRIKRFLHSCKPDIVLSYTIKPVIYGSLAAKWAGVPSIYSMITGLGYAFLKDGYKGLIIRKFVTGLYCSALHFNTSVFFQNPDDRDLFIKLGILTELKTVLINGSGVDIDYYAANPPDNAPVFLMIARLLRDKGVLEYIEAARILKHKYPQAIFQLLGPFDSNPAGISKIDLNVWQQEGIIEYLGSTNDVRPNIQHANIYVLPSYREGTPRTVLEAMAMGRPIVTTNVPGCRETVINEYNGFLVEVKNSKSLAIAMEKFILQPELIVRMGTRSREIAEEKYDVHKVNTVIMQEIGLT